MTTPNATDRGPRWGRQGFHFRDCWQFWAAGLGDARCICSEAAMDAEARAAAVRSEHEATHGEAEMCGADCIALGLADFDDEPEEAP